MQQREAGLQLMLNQRAGALAPARPWLARFQTLSQGLAFCYVLAGTSPKG